MQSQPACQGEWAESVFKALSGISGYCSLNNMQRKLLLCPGFGGSL